MERRDDVQARWLRAAFVNERGRKGEETALLEDPSGSDPQTKGDDDPFESAVSSHEPGRSRSDGSRRAGSGARGRPGEARGRVDDRGSLRSGRGSTSGEGGKQARGTGEREARVDGTVSTSWSAEDGTKGRLTRRRFQ